MASWKIIVEKILDIVAAIAYTLIMDTRRLNIKLDGETHKALKMEAVRSSMTLQELVVHLIKQRVYHTTNVG